MPDRKFQVFLSHNSKDKAVVRELATALQERGIRVWLDEDELVPGENWQPALARAIVNSLTVAVCLGSSGIGPWEDEEMQGAVILAVREKRRVIPVVLPSAPEKPEISLFLANRTWVDFRSGFSDEGINLLIWGITGRKRAKSIRPAPRGHGYASIDRRNARQRIESYIDQLQTALQRGVIDRSGAMTKLDALLTLTQADAQAAQYDPQELNTIFGRGSEASRILALALAQDRPTATSLPMALEATSAPRSPWEQYLALLVLEALVPVLTPDQQREIQAAIRRQQGQYIIRENKGRWTVAGRILRKIKDVSSEPP